MNIIILADGEYPTAKYPLELIKNADIIICCDASVEKLKGRVPNYIVGDMDSLNQEYYKKYNSIIHKSSCQETNDLTKAFSFALGLVPDKDKCKIHILGSTGKREDHSLGNISLLAEYANSIGEEILPFNNKMEANVEVDMVTDFGVFTPYLDTFTKECSIGQQISIFSFDNSLKLCSKGLKYSTDDVVFDYWWKATLNEAVENKYTLTFNHTSCILVFECY